MLRTTPGRSFGRCCALFLALVAVRAGAAPTLDGTAWTLSSLASLDASPSDVQVTLRFEDGRLVGSDGCNRFRGAYERGPDGVTLSPGATTMMACPDLANGQARLYRQATLFREALGAATTATLDGESLVLADADGQELARFAPQSITLPATTWRVTGFNSGDDAVTSLADGTRMTLDFGPSDSLAGSSGCNRYRATYTVTDPEALVIGPVLGTRRLCAGPEGVMAQEDAYLAALGRARSFRIDADRLELRDADGALQVVATRRALDAPTPPAATAETPKAKPDDAAKASTPSTAEAEPKSAPAKAAAAAKADAPKAKPATPPAAQATAEAPTKKPATPARSMAEVAKAKPDDAAKASTPSTAEAEPKSAPSKADAPKAKPAAPSDAQAKATAEAPKTKSVTPAKAMAEAPKTKPDAAAEAPTPSANEAEPSKAAAAAKADASKAKPAASSEAQAKATAEAPKTKAATPAKAMAEAPKAKPDAAAKAPEPSASEAEPAKAAAAAKASEPAGESASATPPSAAAGMAPGLARSEARLAQMRRAAEGLPTRAGRYGTGDRAVRWSAHLRRGQPVVVDEQRRIRGLGESRITFYFGPDGLEAYRESGYRRTEDGGTRALEILCLYEDGMFVDGYKRLDGLPVELTPYEETGPMLQAYEALERVGQSR